MAEFENQALWDICMKHGSRIAQHRTVTQVAILDMYDEILPLCAKPAAPKPVSKSVQRRLAIQASPEPKVEEHGTMGDSCTGCLNDHTPVEIVCNVCARSWIGIGDDHYQAALAQRKEGE